ncbi:hypothetical protein BWQ96_07583 [Gracilariopsis chorda]|uniref:Uncharacterized protein n=1 Tax=Gracilariopsis chorda TaxID=448386 RepID=A0A2V3IKV7_9FLOR|nr:hypothetical protein BWQ96_07583 [Gracilariopsis chorda]|eukprot:PXF42697.1 hypothetical protein BWQ96_07583 [Gracilariopsis chorda]
MLLEGIGPVAVKNFPELLKELRRRFNRGPLAIKNMLHEFHTVPGQYPKKEERVTVTDADGQTTMASLFPANRANVKLTRRKKSFTERLHAKKRKLVEKHDHDNGFEKKIRKVPKSPQESNTTFHHKSTKENVANCVTKAVNITESVHSQ